MDKNKEFLESFDQLVADLAENINQTTFSMRVHSNLIYLHFLN